ncbi:ADP-ribosylglycohydrolase family protein [Mesorhizobium sp. M0152]|uniref:ADP-ribosylglycohydrolase family protein n=1 Tax=Mesorhizobium sp. M0152 TaxID=2956898 RepID=UPI0033357FEA
MNVNQATGCLVGLAIGDALGATLEFGPRMESNSHTEMIGKGPFGLKPGEYTDDTAMALALAASIIEKRTFDPFETAMQFSSWYMRGKYASNGRCFDIGNTTRKALDRFIERKAAIAWPDEQALGNGALMRLAPVPIAYWRSPEKAAGVGDIQARITHNNDINAAICSWLAYKLAKQMSSPTSLFHHFDDDGRHLLISPSIVSDLEDLATLRRDEVSSSGHVVDTLVAALWSVQTTTTFEDAVVTAVNLGNDADTVGAVTGMIAGAIYGYKAIPERWRKVLKYGDAIKATAQRLTQN